MFPLCLRCAYFLTLFIRACGRVLHTFILNVSFVHVLQLLFVCSCWTIFCYRRDLVLPRSSCSCLLDAVNFLTSSFFFIVNHLFLLMSWAYSLHELLSRGVHSDLISLPSASRARLKQAEVVTSAIVIAHGFGWLQNFIATPKFDKTVHARWLFLV